MSDFFEIFDFFEFLTKLSDHPVSESHQPNCLRRAQNSLRPTRDLSRLFLKAVAMGRENVCQQEAGPSRLGGKEGGCGFDSPPLGFFPGEVFPLL